jgi:hypothetical protein
LQPLDKTTPHIPSAALVECFVGESCRFLELVVTPQKPMAGSLTAKDQVEVNPRAFEDSGIRADVWVFHPTGFSFAFFTCFA